jgi:rubredoxin
MRITIQGRKTVKPFTGEWRCNTCGCVWIMENSDEEKVEHNPGLKQFTMRCPECSTIITRGEKK